MSAPLRLLCLAIFVVFAASFWMAPAWLGLDETGLFYRAAIVQLAGPLLAAAICCSAALRSRGSDRTAWFAFAAGSALYVAGNALYVYYGSVGVDVMFPALPELGYFLMAAAFALGMFLYGKVRQQVSPVQIYNFALVSCSVILASLFLLQGLIDHSVMAPFATMVAFLYPALWFSVAASGLISLLIYSHGSKTFAFVLMVIAVALEAIADFAYAQELLSGTYRAGGETQLMWVCSAALIVWAGLEQRTIAARPQAEPERRHRVQSIAEAAVPASAIGVVLLAGSLSGALGGEKFVQVSAVLAFFFALFSGLREYWIIRTHRVLRLAGEKSRIALEESQERLMSVVESTSDSLIVVDHDWRVEYFNQNAAQSVGGTTVLKLGANLWDLFPTEVNSETSDRYRVAMDTRQPMTAEEHFGNVWFDIRAYPHVHGLSIFFRDITEQKKAREELQHMAEHDPLTGLANRTVFQSRLGALVDQRARFAVILIDVDHFKEVNDTLGHPVGDALLKATADRLTTRVGPNDLVARLGGDEFVFIAEGADAAVATRLAQQLADAAATPHKVEGETIRLGASIGIALSDSATDPARIFRNADIALYAAKASGRGAFRVFEPSMETGMLERQALRADLRTALENNQFALHFQPLVDLRSGKVSGFEALLRWKHPTRGMVPPDQFIPIAEESGLIVAIGEWVLRNACAEAAKWPSHVSVAVNISTREFASGELAHSVKLALKASGLEAGRLELEITETVLLRNNRANLATLHLLREQGVRIAIDDFGTGYSSLAYLQQFPFSKIKIDRSFVAGLPGSDASQAIVRSVIGLGMSLGMRVTAEGVETREQYDWVRLGCNEAQGYYISPPVPAAKVAGLLAKIDGAAGPGERQQMAG